MQLYFAANHHLCQSCFVFAYLGRRQHPDIKLKAFIVTLQSLSARVSLFAFAASFVVVGGASAQTPAQTPPSSSQIPPGEEVNRTTPPATIDLRIGGQIKAPPGADAISLTLAVLDVNGTLPELANTTSAIAPKVGATVTLAELYAFAARLQEAYFNAGFPLVRVFIPVQDLDQAAARVQVLVVSGYIGVIDTSGVPENVRRPIEALMSRLVNQQPLRAVEIERAVLLAGEVAGVTLSSSLMAGEREGEVRLILTATYNPVQLSLSIDNQLVDALGNNQATLSAAFNGLLGRGDRIGLTVATALDDVSLSEDALRRYVAGNADILVGNDGLALGVDGSTSSSRPGGTAALLKLRSDFTRFGLSAAYPTVRTRERAANTRISLDFVEERQFSDLLGFPVELSRDELRVVRLQHGEQVRLSEDLLLGVDVELSHGLDGLGARTAADATPLLPLSRVGADATFNKLVLEVATTSHVPSLGGNFVLTARGQTSFDEPLLRSEQFSVASANLISGPPPGSVVGDTGWGARLQYEQRADLEQVPLLPYAFVAAAKVELENPTILESSKTELHAWGLGLRARFELSADSSIGLSMEWSRTDGDLAGLESDAFNVRLTLRWL